MDMETTDEQHVDTCIRREYANRCSKRGTETRGHPPRSERHGEDSGELRMNRCIRDRFRYRPNVRRPRQRSSGRIFSLCANVAREDTARGFWRGRAGAVSIEAVLAIGVFVLGFAGLMEIVGATFETDRMGRAAHAAARALALNPNATPQADFACSAIRRELVLDATFDCTTEWTINIDSSVSPAELPATLDAAVGSNSGDMVLVRIGWTRGPWSFAQSTPPASPTSLVAIGLARSEP